jgi:hypothetical protein
MVVKSAGEVKMSFGDVVKSATNYVLENSWTARHNSKHASRLANAAIMEIYLIPAHERRHMSKSDLRAHIKAKLKKRNVGNPIVITLILQVLVGIVAKLIVDWWWKNKRDNVWP